MRDLADLLGGFGTRTNDLLRDTWKFTLSLNNIITYSPVAWNHKGLDPVPFSRAMLQLEDELKALSRSIMDAQDDRSVPALERLYEKVEPAFRVVFGDGKGESQLAADAISLYLEQQQVLIFTYTGKTPLVVRSSYQDIFLRQLASHTLVKHPFLSKESLDRASLELKAYAEDFLRSLHRIYKTDIEGIFRKYHALLVDMHDGLSKHPMRVPTYGGVPPRRIACTGAGVVSDFIGEMREMPDLEDSQREQILTLRDADGRPETELYRRLAVSPDWGAELGHVVAYMHQLNQDPLAKYEVFEAGPQGDLQPVEIEEARSDQVIDQEKNVARLRTLLTAFVKGSHMPFTLLEGEGGVGKTLSLQALVREIEGLKLVLISSDYLGQIREYAQRMAEGPWRTVLYIDDMTFDPRHFESFKIGTQGMKRFYDNVTVMAAANPSSLAQLPPEVLRRWPIRIKYGRPNLANGVTLRKVLKANCDRVGMEYQPSLVTAFRKLHRRALKTLPPSAVYDFLREVKLTRGL
ncbi:MAG: ATP-binding protein [Acidobacteriia bacterium]|nr:ATP-binding protein [Terriglobia bacterium]